MNNRLGIYLIACVLLVSVRTANAHFPWLITTDDGKATLFFGESIADRNYKMPESIAKAKVRSLTKEGATSWLKVAPVETESLIGLQSEESVAEATLILTEVPYGIYHGSQLNYTTIHQCGKLMKELDAEVARSAKAKLFAVAVDTETGVDVFVTWQGKPLAGSEVHLFCDEGHEEATSKTDSSGKVSFTDAEVESGLNGVMLGHTVDVKDSKEYDSASHYLTLTFTAPEDSKPSARKLADLPFEITSFGAVRVGDAAFVYGGHTGDAHSYSTEEQSNQLLSLDLTNPDATWQEVAKGERLQGLAMVPHGSRLVLVGGFTAKNAKGEEHDLHSQASVRAYDTKTQQWSDLPSLPSGRSSHDAAIIGDTIYAVGGWMMGDEEENKWHDTALSLDLSAAKPQWKQLPAPPFQRRALATVAHNGRLYVIGGMDKENGPTREVFVFDPADQQWKQGPDLIGKGRMAGFGAAGWSIGGELVVSTYEGDILVLAEDGSEWNSVGKSADSRFFHRLVPFQSHSLIAVGGANMEEGKFLNIEILDVAN